MVHSQLVKLLNVMEHGFIWRQLLQNITKFSTFSVIQILTLQNENSSLQIAALNDEQDALDAVNSDLEEEIADQEGEITDLKGKIAVLEGEIADLRAGME